MQFIAYTYFRATECFRLLTICCKFQSTILKVTSPSDRLFPFGTVSIFWEIVSHQIDTLFENFSLIPTLTWLLSLYWRWKWLSYGICACVTAVPNYRFHLLLFLFWDQLTVSAQDILPFTERQGSQCPKLWSSLGPAFYLLIWDFFQNWQCFLLATRC